MAGQFSFISCLTGWEEKGACRATGKTEMPTVLTIGHSTRAWKAFLDLRAIPHFVSERGFECCSIWVTSMSRATRGLRQRFRICQISRRMKETLISEKVLFSHACYTEHTSGRQAYIVMVMAAGFLNQGIAGLKDFVMRYKNSGWSKQGAIWLVTG